MIIISKDMILVEKNKCLLPPGEIIEIINLRAYDKGDKND